MERIAHWLSASGVSWTSSEAVPTGSERELESGIDRSSSTSKAGRVLNSIAEKAGLDVQKVANNPPTRYMNGSKAKGKRSTKRHRFIGMWSFDDLMKVANVVSDAIDLFMDKTRSKEQKAWLVKRVCGKRKRT